MIEYCCKLNPASKIIYTKSMAFFQKRVTAAEGRSFQRRGSSLRIYRKSSCYISFEPQKAGVFVYD